MCQELVALLSALVTYDCVPTGRVFSHAYADLFTNCSDRLGSL